MKKSKIINLVLVTSILTSCTNKITNKKVYMRSDSTASYTSTTYTLTSRSYYSFRPYGKYENEKYNKSGYYSSAISEKSNIGTNSVKNRIVRGGFGSSGFSVSS